MNIPFPQPTGIRVFNQTNATSLWDILPNEIKNMVWEYAGPLTQFLCNRIPQSHLTHHETIRTIWIDAFDMDWPGNIFQLPYTSTTTESHVLTNFDLCHVKSRSMFWRLHARFPESNNNNLTHMDDLIHTYVLEPHTHLAEYLIRRIRAPKTPFRLLHIAMHRMWLDILDTPIHIHPYALANYCVVYDHARLFHHLVLNSIVDVLRITHVVYTVHNDTGSFYDTIPSTTYASMMGYLDILIILNVSESALFDASTMDHAAQNGHLHIVKWLRENRGEGCTVDAIGGASANGYMDVVAYLREHFPQMYDAFMLNNSNQI